MGKKLEKQTPDPQMISEKAFLSLLRMAELQQQTPPFSHADDGETEVWDELGRILYGYHDGEEETELQEGPMARFWQETVSSSKESLTASHIGPRARRAFVATLAEWMQMHDNHEPFANGPPRKGQACAKVENEHSHQETVHCGKLFPRPTVEPGREELQEDPRRKNYISLGFVGIATSSTTSFRSLRLPCCLTLPSRLL